MKIEWLLHNSAKQIDDEAVNESLKWRSSEIERPNEAVRPDSLFQSRIGEATKLP